MNSQKQNVIRGAFLAILLIAADQITKQLALLFLSGRNGVFVIPGVLELFYLENRGAAFGIFADRQWFFILIAVVMLLITAGIFIRTPRDSFYCPLRIICILIFAGAVGNMIDRILHHFVIDFLYLSLIDFPVFNLADCYVCVGAAAAVLAMFTVYKEESFAFLKHDPTDHNGENK